MREASMRALKVVVEQAVRSVQATVARKRRMREELLAHLTSIFEEEHERLGDERAALDRARQRFGDPGELSGQLQQTVPRWDRLAAASERLDLQPGESFLHFAGKHLLGQIAGFTVMMAVVGLPCLLARGRQAEVLTVLGIVACVIPFTAAATVVFLFLPHRIGPLLYGPDSERSLGRAAWCGVASLAILPALGFGTYWALSGDLASSLAHLRFACLFAPAAPVVLAMMARTMAEESRYKEEWASLDIDS